MFRFRRLTTGEILILTVFLAVLGGVGFVVYTERQVTPVWVVTPEKISLSADGLGVLRCALIQEVRDGLIQGLSF